MKSNDSCLSIYEYTDYRCFLKDRFQNLKAKNPHFSYRSFNQRAGISSSAFLKLVLEGKRNLGHEGIQKTILGFQLSEAEAAFFERLVHFTQAPTHEEKDRHFRAMLALKPFAKAQPLTAAQYRLFSRWYFVAILELVRAKTTELKDEHWLERSLTPKIPLRDIQQAVRALKKLGLLVQDSRGDLVRQQPMLSTPDEVRSLGAVNYHLEMSGLAALAVQDSDPESREFSGLTIAVDRKTFAKAKAEIQKFRKRLHAILEEAPSEKNLVVQLNLQLFTLGRSGHRKES